jgi:hypothetical protein
VDSVVNRPKSQIVTRAREQMVNLENETQGIEQEAVPQFLLYAGRVVTVVEMAGRLPLNFMH